MQSKRATVLWGKWWHNILVMLDVNEECMDEILNYPKWYALKEQHMRSSMWGGGNLNNVLPGRNSKKSNYSLFHNNFSFFQEDVHHIWCFHMYNTAEPRTFHFQIYPRPSTSWHIRQFISTSVSNPIIFSAR